MVIRVIPARATPFYLHCQKPVNRNDMPNRFSLSVFLTTLLALFAAPSCDSGSGGGASDNFDRQAMLRNYAENLIQPAYIQLQNRANALQAAVEVFATNPEAALLTDVRTAWQNAYTDWQYANAYNFGPAGESGLRKGLIEEIGTFPASTTKIEAAVAAGTWNLDDFNRDARGFLAVEYLVFGENQSIEEVAAAFAGNSSRLNYLLALAEDMSDRSNEVLTAWNGSYRDEFIRNDGTDVGSSTSQLYNEFVRSFEAIKNFKLALPLGKRPGQVQTEPQLVEAYYSGTSLDMLKNHFTAIENIWHGRARSGQGGIGFREYLESVEGGPALIADTETQLTALKAALAAVPANPAMSAQVAGDKTQLEALYTEFSKMTRYFKSDMSSLLGIAITFSSGDGD